jgi:hypothetical protein
MSTKVGFVAALGANQTIHLPVFLSGDDLMAFKAGQGVHFAPVTLLYGILYGASDDPPTVDFSLSASYFSKALSLLVPELNMPNVEELILRAGANVRQEFGSFVSGRMLENGLQFVPESARIRSDCIVDLWAAAEDRMEPDHHSILRKILEILKELDLEGVSPAAKKCLSYIATVAFSEVEPANLDLFIEENFETEDLRWTDKEKEQIAEYMSTKRFSWSALAF